MRKESYTDTCFDERSEDAGAPYEAENRREAKFDYITVFISFIGVPICDMAFSYQSEMPASNFPPIQASVPNSTEIQLLHMMVSSTSCDLYSPSIC